MRCQIDDGTLDHLVREGYVDKWKCRRCKVVWILKPEGDVDTDKEIIFELLKQKLEEYEKLKERGV
jgi:hypothetical protein